MADVTHAPIGFTGSVDQVGEAKRFQGVTVPFRAMSATDWAVTVTGTALTVQIAAGSGQAYGVRDITSTAATIAAGANSGASTRYDAVVATFNWAAGTPNVSFRVIAGTTSPPVVNTTGSVVAGQINRIPGVQYDAVLAIIAVRVGVGAFSTTDLFDSRVWGGHAGPLSIPTATYLSFVDGVQGSQARTVDSGQLYVSDGTTWTMAPHPRGVVAYGSSASAATVSASTIVRMLGGVNLSLPLYPGRLYEYELACRTTNTGAPAVYARAIAGATPPVAGTGTVIGGDQAPPSVSPVLVVGKFTVSTPGTYTISPFVEGTGTASGVGPQTVSGLLTATIRDSGPSAGIVGTTPIAVP